MRALSSIPAAPDGMDEAAQGLTVTAVAVACALATVALVTLCAVCAGSKAKSVHEESVKETAAAAPPPLAIPLVENPSFVSIEGSAKPEATVQELACGSSHLASSLAGTTAGVQEEKCDIELDGDSVEDVMRLLHRLCDEMEGHMGPSHLLHKESIRRGINTAIAEVTSNGVTSTAMFFPRHNRYARQMKMYRKQWICDFMPNMNMCNGGVDFRHKNQTVMLPPHILVDRCTSVQDAIARCKTDSALSTEVFLICIQLYHQISAFHIRKKVVRDICMKNIVQTLTGTQRRWTLLEYCSSAAAGTESTHVPLRMTTPELAVPRMRGEGLKMERPFDIWQLGVLVYEIVQRRPYWRPDISESELLHSLASADVPLPHEETPMKLDNVQEMLRLLLARQPTDRPKHDGLNTVLEDHDKSGTVGVWTNYPSQPNAQNNKTVELPV